MQDVTDMELLREYARQNSEAAFTELVRRHVNLVYSAALRHVGNAAQAEEIAQAVFIILARKAGHLREGLILEAWLFETTRLTALSFLRGERRRQFREQEAYMQSTLQQSTSDPTWQQFSPVLDEAMMRLGRHEREAVVLRFFKDQSMGEVAAALKIKEPAAQMRVGRALEKLRGYFLRRGISSTTAMIAGAVSANSVHAAPAGLANTISAAALAKGAAASASTLTLAKGALKVMAWTKAKTTVAGIAVALLLGIGTTAIVMNTLLPVPNVQGTWVATLPLAGSGIHAGEAPTARLVFKVTETNGNYQATVDDLDQGVQNIPISFTYKYPLVHGENASLNVAFDGKVNRFGTTISGKAMEINSSISSLAHSPEPLVLKYTSNPPAFPQALTAADYAPRDGSVLQGFWDGMIGGRNGLQVNVKIAEAPDGTFRADFSCPPQGGNRQPTTVHYDGKTVQIITMAGYGMFEGKLGSNNTVMTGNWIQGGSRTRTTFTLAPPALSAVAAIDTVAIRADGSIDVQATIEETNKTSHIIRTDSMDNQPGDVLRVTDELGHPMKYTRNGNDYLMTLDRPVPPGGQISYNIEEGLSAKYLQAAGVIKTTAPDTREWKLTFSPNSDNDCDLRNVWVLYLPPGATLLAEDSGMTVSTNAGQVEVRYEKIVPPNGGEDFGFRYRLAANSP